jgi:cytochrome b6-f complex iron-sulfur subunit
MERRIFLRWFGTGILASSLPVAIAACFSENSSEENSPTNNETGSETARQNEPDADGFIVVGTVAALNEEGYIIDKKLEAIVTRQSDESLAAVNIKCTHKQCDVEWRSNDKNLACPCHGSKFAPDGTVVEGPADTPLAGYEVKEEEGSILVKAS